MNRPPQNDRYPENDYVYAGWNACLNSVLASLQGYPHMGGDIQIMEEVERLIRRYGGTPPLRREDHRWVE